MLVLFEIALLIEQSLFSSEISDAGAIPSELGLGGQSSKGGFAALHR